MTANKIRLDKIFLCGGMGGYMDSTAEHSRGRKRYRLGERGANSTSNVVWHSISIIFPSQSLSLLSGSWQTETAYSKACCNGLLAAVHGVVP